MSLKPKFTLRKKAPARPTTVDAWEEGARAARAGEACSDNPHKPDRYEFVTWLHGWAQARHTLAKESK